MPRVLVNTGRRVFRPEIYLGLGAILILAGFLALNLGATGIGSGQVLGVIASKLGLQAPWTFGEGQAQVIWSIRLPRVLMAALIGMSLAISGAALQGIFRNPLADPGLIGVSSGCALGAALIIVISPAWLMNLDGLARYFCIPIAAFIGGLIATSLVYRLATRHGRTSVATMLLAGIALNALCGAGVGLLSYVSDDVALRSLISWSLGSLSTSTWTILGIITPVVLISSLVLGRHSKALNLLLLGESEAFHLGVDLKRVKLIVVVFAALIVGVGVGFTGLIGFVGLVVPHIARLLWGPDHRVLLPSSALLGAIVLVLADLLCRTVVAPSELPIGIVSAVLGAPFFLVLMVRHLHQEVH